VHKSLVLLALYLVILPVVASNNQTDICLCCGAPVFCSIWTIDLAHLLARFGVEVSFCTITIGINRNYANERFYMEHLTIDEARVQTLFDAARSPSSSIKLQQRSVPLREIVEWLGAGQHLAILLVDKRKLDPWQVSRQNRLWNAFDKGCSVSY
jgi:hypothetical protein